MSSIIRPILMILMLCAGASIFALSGVAIFTYHDLSHPESLVPWACRQIANGEVLYPDWRQWPHRFMPYGPLLTYPIGVVCRIFGVEGFGFHLYLAGRAQSFLYMVGIGILIARALNLTGWRRRWALTFSFSYIALWPGLLLPALSFRADLPAIFWVFAGAIIAFQPISTSTLKNLLPALVCFMISLAYKPSLWSLPAAIALFCLYQNGLRTSIKWCVSVVIAVILYAGVGNAITDGRFLLNQVGASSMGLSTELFELSWTFLTTPQPFPILTWDLCLRFLCAVPIAVILIRKPNSDFERGFSIYYLIALTVNLLTMFKMGAGLNYLLESYYLSGIVLAIGAARIFTRENQYAPAIRYGTIAVITALFVLPLPWFTFKNAVATRDLIKKLNQSSPLDDLVDLPPTAILGDLAFIHPAPAAHALSDPLPYVQLTGKGWISQQPLADRITSQAFSHFVMSPTAKYLFFAPDRAPWVGDLLKEYYTPAIVIPEYEIWQPRKSAQTTSTNISTQPLSE